MDATLHSQQGTSRGFRAGTALVAVVALLAVGLLGLDAASTQIGGLPKLSTIPADAPGGAPAAGSTAKDSGVVDVAGFEETALKIPPKKAPPPPPPKVKSLTTQQTIKRVSVFRR